MLIMNVGRIAVNFSKTQEAYLKMIMGRHLLIFSVALWQQKFYHIINTLIFVILVDYAFNENSRFCVLPKTMK